MSNIFRPRQTQLPKIGKSPYLSLPGMKRTGFIPYLPHTSCTRETRWQKMKWKQRPAEFWNVHLVRVKYYNLRFPIFPTDGRLNFEKAIFLEEWSREMINHSKGKGIILDTQFQIISKFITNILLILRLLRNITENNNRRYSEYSKEEKKI